MAIEFALDTRRSSLGTFRTGPLVRITARSITFCSSRILPGQGYLTSVVMVSDGIVSIALLMRRLNCCTKCRTSRGMSSGRSRSAGHAHRETR